MPQNDTAEYQANHTKDHLHNHNHNHNQDDHQDCTLRSCGQQVWNRVYKPLLRAKRVREAGSCLQSVHTYDVNDRCIFHH